MLHLRPELGAARPRRAGNTAPLSALLPHLRAGGVAAVSRNGVLGDPRGATAEEGERLLADHGRATRSARRRREGRPGHRRRRRHRQRDGRPAGRDEYAVVALDVRTEVEALAGRADVVPVVADVRDRAALDAAVASAVDRFGRLDAVVAAAAVIAGGRPLWETDPAELDELLDVDTRGVWNTAAAAVPAMLAGPDPSGCRFVAVASAAAHQGMFGLAAYNVAKHGVVGLVKGLAADLVGTGVTAAAVSPGLHAHADARGHRGPLRPPGHRAARQHQLLRRLLEPDEVAAAIAFCCSREGAVAQRQRRPRRRRLLVTATVLTRRRLPDGFAVRLRDDVRLATTAAGSWSAARRCARCGSPSARGRCVDGRPRRSCDGAASELGPRASSTATSPTPCRRTRQPTPTELTVVVPVRDRPEQLDRCLAALRAAAVHRRRRRLARPGRGRRGRRAARRHAGPADHNVGPAGARNAGLRRVRTPYVAFVDSDVAVDGRTLLRLARHFADDAGRPRRTAGPGVSRSRRGRGGSNGTTRTRPPSTSATGLLGPARAPQVAWLPGACLVGRVDRARRAGFDGGPAGRRGRRPGLAARRRRRRSSATTRPRSPATTPAPPSAAGSAASSSTAPAAPSLAERHGDRTASRRCSADRRRRRRPRSCSPPVVAARRRPRRAAAPAVHWRRSPTRRARRRGRRLAVRGLGWAVRQESALLLRHWWPAAAVACHSARRARRMIGLGSPRRPRPGLSRGARPGHGLRRPPARRPRLRRRSLARCRPGTVVAVSPGAAAVGFA